MLLRRLFFLLCAAAALSPPLLSQVNASGTITSTQCVSVSAAGQSTVGIQITGTWTGTLQPKLSVQGQSPANIQVVPSTSSTAQSTITANGVYQAKVAGGSTFLVCGATVGSGTANVYLTATQAVALVGVGGFSPSTTASGIAFPTAGATAPSPVGTNTCVGNTAGWAQNAAGTYETQFSIDTSLTLGGLFDTPGLLTICRPPIFNATGVTPGFQYNGTIFDTYGRFDPTHVMGIQERYENVAPDSSSYTAGNLNAHYSEMFFNGTPTVTTTFVANTRVRFDDSKTGGSKPSAWAGFQSTGDKSAAYDITNCSPTFIGFTHAPCYVAYFGDRNATLSGDEDETGAIYDVFAGGTKDAGNHALNATGNVFHALIQSSTNNMFAFTNGFTSEDFGSSTNRKNILSKGTATSGYNEFQGPTIFGTDPTNLGSLGFGTATGGITKSSIKVNNAGSGDIDLFTVPANSRAIAIFQHYNTAGTNTTWFTEVKISGTYYRNSSNSTTNTNTSAASGWVGIVLEAGQTFAINYSQAGMNVWGTAYVFPNTANIKSAILTSLASGENTIYTCCSGTHTTATVLLGNSQMLGSNNAAIIEVSNGSGGALNYYYSIVSSGGSPGSGNKAVPTAAVSNGAISTFGAFNNFTLASGDFISINASGTSANTLAWVTVQEQ